MELAEFVAEKMHFSIQPLSIIVLECIMRDFMVFFQFCCESNQHCEFMIVKM